MEILVGTSGYDYKDWVGEGRFYPASLAGRHQDWLTYYASQYPIVELNFTYYGETDQAQMERMLRRVDPSQSLVLLEGVYSPLPDFGFVIKAYSTLTHNIGQDWADVANKFKVDIEPLECSGRLKGILAQFPSSFHRTMEHTDYLKGLAESMAGLGLAMEFRHRSWFTDDAKDEIASLPITGIGADAPREANIPALAEQGQTTGGIAYVRLHGRREGHWWTGDASSRYEYEYSEKELTELAKTILSYQVETVYILFNNHRHAGAAKNARQVMELFRKLMGQDVVV